jgi:hypothetical protein
LGLRLRRPQNYASISKWVGIVASLSVFGFWSYSSLLWVYALLPLGPKQANLMSTIGAVNSLLTLLVAGIVTTLTFLKFNQKKILDKRLASGAVILLGSYAAIYSLVSIWIPIYFSFIKLTEIWMIIFPILGVAILKVDIQK